jgi:uncharacterized protein
MKLSRILRAPFRSAPVLPSRPAEGHMPGGCLPEVEGPHYLVYVIADTDVRPEILEYERCDLLISLGDISDETIMHYAWRLQNPPIFAVRGIRDSDRPFPDEVVDLDADLATFGSLSVLGLRGCDWDSTRPHALSQREAQARLRGAPRADIVIAHNSPRGIHDRGGRVNRGFEALAEYIRRHQPAFVLHGHQRANQVTRVGSTWVVGTHGHRFLRIPRTLPNREGGLSPRSSCVP